MEKSISEMVAEEFGRRIEAQSSSAREAAKIGYLTGLENGMSLAEPIWYDADEAPEPNEVILAKPKGGPVGMFQYVTSANGDFYFAPVTYYAHEAVGVFKFALEDIEFWTLVPELPEK
jgi:hypothetical protein